MPFLQTERLTILPFTQSLIEAVIAMASAADDASLASRRGALTEALGARVPADWPGSDVADALPFFLAQEQADPGWTALILHDGQLVGDIGFKGGPDQDGTVEIGYSLVPAARGQGFATEAVRAMTDWARQQPKVQRVTAETESANPASMRVLERAGFQRTGETDGLVLWVYVG